MHPRGPLPPGVYWVRRVVAVLVIIAILAAARWGYQRIFRSASSSSPNPSPTASVTTTPSTSTSPTPSPSKTTTPSPSKSTSPSASASTLRSCANSDIRVTASTDAASYVVGSTPKLRMRIQNISSTPCRRDLGAAANELVITSGTAHVWSSDDCNPATTNDVQTMQPDQSFSVTVTWLGRLSAKGCPANQPYAQPGSYKLTGRNGGVTSAPAIFALTQG